MNQGTGRQERDASAINRLDLTSPEARADANRALPELMIASVMGDERATAYASQIIGQTISDALQPSVQAMHRLASYRSREALSADQGGCEARAREDRP